MAATLALAAVLSSVAAQAPPEADSLARAFQAEHGIPGLAVGFIEPSGARTLFLGRVNEGGAPVDADTRFEIGSVTKVLTSLLLADMVVRGEVALEDSLGGLRGRERQLPPEVAGITLRQLATHTSGLPRLPTNLLPEDFTDPYAGYSEEDLDAFLQAYELPRAPGARFEYSNVGVGLLATLLTQSGDRDFGDLLEERVLAPLGLDATCVPRGDACTERVARGHGPGGPVPFWTFDALAGAGALRSSLTDLVTLLRHQLEPVKGPLEEAIETTHRILDEGPGALQLALGWHVAPLPGDSHIYFHNGGTGGFRSFVGFSPEARVGVVVLANRSVDLEAFDQFALRLLLATLEA